MNNLTISSISYYIITWLISVTIAVGLYLLLDWPKLAEIPLSICVLIESYYLFHLIYVHFWEDVTGLLKNTFSNILDVQITDTDTTS